MPDPIRKEDVNIELAWMATARTQLAISDLDAYQQYCDGMVKYCLENGDHATAAQWTALRDRVIQVRHSKAGPSPTPKRTPERRRYRGTPRQRHETTEESTPVSTPTPVSTRPLYWPLERLDEP